MADIDDLLSASLKRLATPGDPAGVADAIRARVDAGDTGTPAAKSGWRPARLPGWFPWIGILVVIVLLGGGIGAGQIAARSAVQVAAPKSPVTATAVPTTTPSATPTATPTAAPTPAPTRIRPKPKPVPPVVAQPTHPVPPKDRTRPTLSGVAASPSTIASLGQAGKCNVPTDASTVSAYASDNVGVTSVRATWTGGSASLARSGKRWHFVFHGSALQQDEIYSIRLVARDAAGNASAAVSTRVIVQYCRG
ncbi:MAG: hypothetical protein JWQ12_987 [Glaciihabitans sp.]|nr:hypothetical protein [Glaciihabitans sp.]